MQVRSLTNICSIDVIYISSQFTIQIQSVAHSEYWILTKKQKQKTNKKKKKTPIVGI